MPQADNSTAVSRFAKEVKAPLIGTKEQILSQNPNIDQSDWEWVEVPETDLFGEVHTGVSVNFEAYGPGKHLLPPHLAYEVRRLLDLRLRGDMRILQPRQDKKMFEMMQRAGKPAPRGI